MTISVIISVLHEEEECVKSMGNADHVIFGSRVSRQWRGHGWCGRPWTCLGLRAPWRGHTGCLPAGACSTYSYCRWQNAILTLVLYVQKQESGKMVLNLSNWKNKLLYCTYWLVQKVFDLFQSFLRVWAVVESEFFVEPEHKILTHPLPLLKYFDQCFMS